MEAPDRHRARSTGEDVISGVELYLVRGSVANAFTTGSHLEPQCVIVALESVESRKGLSERRA